MSKYVLCLFLLVCQIAIAKVPLADRFITTPIYETYVSQLQEFVNAETPKTASNELQSFIDYIKKGPGLRPRVFHKEFINQLRYLIAHKKKDLSTEEFVDKLSIWLYTKPLILPQCQEFLFQQCSIEYRKSTYLESFQQQDFLIRNNQNFDGTLKCPFFNPIYEGDLPIYLYSIWQSNKEVRFFRTQNTTYEYPCVYNFNVTHKAITPEFLNYLTAIKKKGLKHLYINHLERHREETNLVESLDALEGVAVVSLARNSRFYKQEDEQTAHFKERFLRELFVNRDKSNYFWSHKLSEKNLILAIKDVLDEVHSHYFNNRAELSQKERQAFIDLAYIKISDKVIKILQPDFVNISCHISIDRGPTAYTLLYYYYQIQQATYEIDYGKMATLLFGPAAIVRNRGIDKNHFSRFLEAVNYLERVSANTNEISDQVKQLSVQ